MSEKYSGDVHGEGGEFMSSFNTSINNHSQEVAQYIKLLENRLIEYDKKNQQLQKELNSIKHNQELTVKWARGEIEN
tara:strand:- start:669 stop:899 length:231 start_codon:yes stop_codon:yes gene_type:complete